MSMPTFTPDGVTVHVDTLLDKHTPHVFQLPGQGDILEVDLSQLDPAPRFLYVASGVEILLMEVQ